MVDGRVVGEIFQIGCLQFGNIVAHILTQFLVFLVVGESRMGCLGCFFLMENIEQYDGISHHGVHYVQNVHTASHLHAACGCTPRQHPSIAEILVESLQLIHILQDRQHLLLGFQHVGSHTFVVLVCHELQKVVEVLRISLCQFQRIHHAHGLLQIVIFVDSKLLIGDGLISRHEFIHRLVVGQFEGIGGFHIASRQQEQTEQHKQDLSHFQYFIGFLCKDK